MKKRYRALLAYDGTAYNGFQRQAAGIITIQQTVEFAILAVTRQQVAIVGAGRTDSGVHATGQVIAFDVDWQHSDEALLKAINANLPDDIALQSIGQHPDFHPRFDALSRRYQYTVAVVATRQPFLRFRAWQMFGLMDIDAMQSAADLLVGKHDFASFGNPTTGTSTVRTVMLSQWIRHQEEFGTILTYTVEADAFLNHMVRRMVGMMVDVGRKRYSIEEFENILHKADLSLAKTIAPPQGLVLENVRYM